jgi:uncharacterized protein with HEPN domain
VVDAVERCLGRITEAALKLDTQAETYAPGPTWKDIRGLGNILRHGYDAINLDTIWQIVTEHLPMLAAACREALTTLPPDPP